MTDRWTPIEELELPEEGRISLARQLRYGLVQARADRALIKFRPQIVLSPGSSMRLDSSDADVLPDGTQVMPVGDNLVREEADYLIPVVLWEPTELGNPNRDVWAVGCDKISISHGGHISLWGVRVMDKRTFEPTERLAPGRPNLTDEGVEIHRARVAQGKALSNKRAEAAEIHRILSDIHRNDKDWSLKPDSLRKAIREADSSEQEGNN